MKKLIVLAAMITLTATFASAQLSDSATLTVTGTVDESIEMYVSAATNNPLTLTNGGSAAASNAMGIVSKFGAAPSGGWVRSATFDAASYSISGNVKIEVDAANTSHNTIAIAAQLGSAPPTGISWTVNANSMTNLASGSVVSGQPLDVNDDYVADNVALVVTIQDSAADAADLGNVITFTASLTTV
ncbi:MAG TPA: hypothetical protein VMT00_00640 [Thermoanaerobaculia bacterium]|nr:hypothetical protein [Thermoanaerobaculia bacterium]